MSDEDDREEFLPSMSNRSTVHRAVITPRPSFVAFFDRWFGTNIAKQELEQERIDADRRAERARSAREENAFLNEHNKHLDLQADHVVKQETLEATKKLAPKIGKAAAQQKLYEARRDRDRPGREAHIAHTRSTVAEARYKRISKLTTIVKSVQENIAAGLKEEELAKAKRKLVAAQQEIAALDRLNKQDDEPETSSTTTDTPDFARWYRAHLKQLGIPRPTDHHRAFLNVYSDLEDELLDTNQNLPDTIAGWLALAKAKHALEEISDDEIAAFIDAAKAIKDNFDPTDAV